MTGRTTSRAAEETAGAERDTNDSRRKRHKRQPKKNPPTPQTAAENNSNRGGKRRSTIKGRDDKKEGDKTKRAAAETAEAEKPEGQQARQEQVDTEWGAKLVTQNLTTPKELIERMQKGQTPMQKKKNRTTQIGRKTKQQNPDSKQPVGPTGTSEAKGEKTQQRQKKKQED